jgi:hypothetical protein
MILRHLRRLLRHPPIGTASFGHLGADGMVRAASGGPGVAEAYVDTFLRRHGDRLCGRVLEIGSVGKAAAIGGDHVRQVVAVPQLAGLADPPPAGGPFDCILLSLVSHGSDELEAALRRLGTIIAGQGALLATLPGTTHNVCDGARGEGRWNFTAAAVRRLFERAFPGATVEVEAFGNVLSSIAALYELPAGELRREELDHGDPDYPLLIGACVTAPAGPR